MAYRPSEKKEYRGSYEGRAREKREYGRTEENGYGRKREERRGSYARDEERTPRRDGYRPGDGKRNERSDSRGRQTRNQTQRREDFSPRGMGQQETRPVRSERPLSARREENTEERRDYRDYEYRQLQRTETVEERDEDRILCGRNPIREALRSGREIEKILVQKGELSGSAQGIIMAARNQKVMVQEVDRRRLDEIAPHHQGMIAFAAAYAYAEVEDILAVAEERGEDPFIVILDGVTDPHNLGAVIRTAECAGAHGVIIPMHRSVGLTPAAVKASAGAIEHMKIARVTNLNRTIDELKRAGIWTYAVTMEGKDFEKVDFHGGTALVIGAEGEGISRLTAEKCDLAVSLPMKGALDSLNASVAAGIVMYRVLCCRRKK